MREMFQGTQHGLETECRIGREALWSRQIKAISFDIIKTILLIHSSVNCAQNMPKQFNPIEFMTSFTFLQENKRPQAIKAHIPTKYNMSSTQDKYYLQQHQWIRKLFMDLKFLMN